MTALLLTWLLVFSYHGELHNTGARYEDVEKCLILAQQMMQLEAGKGYVYYCIAAADEKG